LFQLRFFPPYYFHSNHFSFFSSLLFAASIERWELHKRVAYRFLMLMGSQPRLLMLGFMLITCLLSMWISNTATTAMMVCLLNISFLDDKLNNYI
jgi:sodium-dependent dicarboxylate transporter 2/3/5